MLPQKRDIQALIKEDVFTWEYYGEGIGKIQSWIFRSRLKCIINLLNQYCLNPEMILDVGCGCMFISYALLKNSKSEYVGVDIMPIEKLKNYRDAMRQLSKGKIEIIRASGDMLPFRNDTFNLVLALDVFEHLNNPIDTATEIDRVIENRGFFGTSLPLENTCQKILRVGLDIMKLMGDPILKKEKQYKGVGHYLASEKTCNDMVRMLNKTFDLLNVEYTPIGIRRSFNVNAIHLWCTMHACINTLFLNRLPR